MLQHTNNALAGKFLVIEGLEGAGKTTAIETVAAVLAQHGISDPIFTREPGGTPLAEALRELIKSGVEQEVPCTQAEILLFYAARIQLVETVIKPALQAGRWVIGDRHDLSTQAYQGGGRQIDPQLMQLLKQHVLAGFKPDLTLYLDIPPQIGLARAQARGQLDRIEQESLAFFERTRERYLALAAADDSIITIDATQSLSAVTQAIRQQVEQWLAQHME